MGKDLVQVAVYVEHESQKGIMVGRGGSALKAMATAARADIEAFVGELNRGLPSQLVPPDLPKYSSHAPAVLVAFVCWQGGHTTDTCLEVLQMNAVVCSTFDRPPLALADLRLFQLLC